MNKQLLELKKSREKEDHSLEYNAADFISNYKETEEPQIELFDDISINLNISQLNDDSMNLDDYKKEIDKTIEEKKKKMKDIYTFKKSIREDEIKEKFEIRFNKIIKEDQDRLDQLKLNKKENIRKSYQIKIQDYKIKIKEEFEHSKNKEIMNRNHEINNQVKILENEISSLRTLQLQNAKDDIDNNYETEIKKLEFIYEKDLKSFKENLDLKLNKKREKIKIELNESKLKNEVKSIPEDTNLSQEILKEKKNMILKSHQMKIENYKENLIDKFLNNFENEKFELLKTLNSVLLNLKENYEFLKEFYDEQKLLFSLELNINSSNNTMTKIKNVLDNKNSILKNLINLSQFILKKKIREFENLKDLKSFTNKEEIIEKISELLSLIFSESIYDNLQSYLNEDNQIIEKNLEELIIKCDKIISVMNCDSKMQLGILINNTNFY